MKTIEFEGQTHEFPDDFTDQDISTALSSAPAAVSVTQDVAKAIPSKLAEGTINTVGLPGTVGGGASGGLIGSLTRSGLRALGVPNIPPEEQAAAAQAKALGGPDISAPNAQTIRSAVEGVTGPLYEPQTLPGKLLGGAAEAVPGALIMPGKAAVNATMGAVSGLTGEAAGQTAKTYAPSLEPYANIAGSLVGGAVAGKTADALLARAAKAANPTPTIEKLFDLGDKTFKQASNLGVEINPTAVSKAAGDIRAGLIQKFSDEDLAANKILSRLATAQAPNAAKPLAPLTGVQAATKAPVTADELKTIREQLGHVAYNNKDATERYAARLAQEGIDDFIGNVPAADIISGDPAKVAELFKKGRDYWAAGRRAEMIAGRIELGDLNAATAASGRNVDNAGRQAIKTMIRPDIKGKTIAQKSGFSDAEIEQMNRVARGSSVENKLRYLGNLFGGGGGMWGGAVGGGGAIGYATTGDPRYLIPAGVGLGAKWASGRMTHRQEKLLDEMIRSRAPGYVYTAPPTHLGNSLLLGGMQALDPQKQY